MKKTIIILFLLAFCGCQTKSNMPEVIEIIQPTVEPTVKTPVIIEFPDSSSYQYLCPVTIKKDEYTGLSAGLPCNMKEGKVEQFGLSVTAEIVEEKSMDENFVLVYQDEEAGYRINYSLSDKKTEFKLDESFAISLIMDSAEASLYVRIYMNPLEYTEQSEILFNELAEYYHLPVQWKDGKINVSYEEPIIDPQKDSLLDSSKLEFPEYQKVIAELVETLDYDAFLRVGIGFKYEPDTQEIVSGYYPIISFMDEKMTTKKELEDFLLKGYTDELAQRIMDNLFNTVLLEVDGVLAVTENDCCSFNSVQSGYYDYAIVKDAEETDTELILNVEVSGLDGGSFSRVLKFKKVEGNWKVSE